MLYFPAGLKGLYLPDRSKGTLPLSEMFQIIVRMEKGRHHLPPPLDRTEAELFLQPEQSLGGSSSVPLELLFNVSYNHLRVQ